MKKPLINWEEIERLTMSGRLPPPNSKNKNFPKSGIGGWDAQAVYYNRMVQMEKNFTLKQLDCFDTSPEDTVLDIGCGPGRISVPIAKRVKSVTALDASPKMLEFCEKYAAEEGVSNVNTLLMDWEDKDAVSKLPKHDIVIVSRALALRDINTLSSFANKYVVLIIWSNNQPCIPQIIGALFEGTSDNEEHRMQIPPRDRRLGNNLLYNKVYDLGYNPNLRIVDDGYEKIFKNKEEAYVELSKLRPGLAEDKMDIFKNNVDKFLTENDDGSIKYFAKTETMVLWWKPEIEE